MRRRTILLCRAYHVPHLSRVAIFPLHMDPPTIQHREIFHLLLGQTLSTRSTLTRSDDAASSTLCTSGAGNADLPLSRYWYLESFARSLQYDSQLTPFEDIILVPNTRYPVGLRRSTHLAALAVMATEDMPGVHVDFTALEHPDESMPIVYELTRQYPNSVLVHTLQDAYEMQNWRHFTEIKTEVPILFLQTKSLPVRLLKQPPPQDTSSRDGGETGAAGHEGSDAKSGEDSTASAATTHTTPTTKRDSNGARYLHADATHRQYHTASALERLGGVLHSPDEKRYYARVEQVLSSSARHRRDRGNHARGLANDVEDSLDLPATQRDIERVPAVLHEGLVSVHVPKKSRLATVTTTQITTPASQSTQTATTSAGDPRANTSSNAGKSSSSPSSPSPPSSPSSSSALSIASLPRHAWSIVTGEWWRTRGGRGDDEVEASRSYNSFSGSSWLVVPYSAVAEAEAEEVERGAWLDRTQATGTAASGGGGAGVAEAEDGALCGPGEWSTEDVVVTSDGSVVLRRHCHPAAQIPLWNAAAAGTQDAAQDGIDDDFDVDEEDVEEDQLADGATFAEQLQQVSRELDDMLKPENAERGHGETPATATPTERRAETTTAAAGSRHAQSSQKRRQARRRPRRTQRRVRELIEELFPPTFYGHHPRGCFVYNPSQSQPTQPSSTTTAGINRPGEASSTTTTTTITAVNNSAAANGGSGDRFLWHDNGPGADRTALSDEPSQLNVDTETLADIAPAEDPFGLTHHFPHPVQLDRPLVPMIEVLPVVRTTGADVRQALWEQTMDPACLLTDRVLRYAESHGLYRDTRKASHAAQYYSSTGAGVSTPASGSGGSGSGSANGSLDGFAGGAGGGSGGGVRRRNPAPRESATMFLPGVVPRLELHYDKNNLLAREQYEKLKVFQCQDGSEPDLIVPIGGDGYMMHCIRKNWRRFIPFYGINAGHVGYLLNDCATMEELFAAPLKLHTTNMLYCQAEKETPTGERVVMAELAFNDAWLERSSGQTALIRILVNGEERIHRLRGDGVLVSTAAGSTAYSQALGASPVPVSAPLIQVVGSNVVSPAQWRPAHLDQEDQVELEVIDNVKRPCRCFVDSVDVGQVTRMLVRSSRVAGVTLAFSTSCDLQHKLYQMQFPRTL